MLGVLKAAVLGRVRAYSKIVASINKGRVRRSTAYAQVTTSNMQPYTTEPQKLLVNFHGPRSTYILVCTHFIHDRVHCTNAAMPNLNYKAQFEL